MKQLKTQIICASAAVLLFGFTGQSTASAVKSESVRNGSTETEQEWTFAAFGQNVVTDENHIGYSVSEDGSVTVWNLNIKGKLVSASTDGLSFYYTAVPARQNFTLTATVSVDSWTFTNGQEGFGLMAADRVGKNGDSTAFWNNSYMACGTRVDYYYDAKKDSATSDKTDTKISMELGLGAQEKTGVTTENLPLLEANDVIAVNTAFSSTMYSLETSCASLGKGTYDLFGNEISGTAVGTVSDPVICLIKPAGDLSFPGLRNNV